MRAHGRERDTGVRAQAIERARVSDVDGRAGERRGRARGWAREAWPGSLHERSRHVGSAQLDAVHAGDVSQHFTSVPHGVSHSPPRSMALLHDLDRSIA